MDYTQLGHTGLTVSRLALGCMSFGSSKWRSWVLNETEAKPFFRRAVEAGINFFDTADMYSLGTSEEVTGRALKEYASREEIVLATKLNFPMTSGPNMGGLSRKHVLQACEASLKRLGVDVIDLYWIHRFSRRSTTSSAGARCATSERAPAPRGGWRRRSRRPSETGGRGSSGCRTTTTFSTARKSAR